MRVLIIGQKWLAAQVLALCQQRGDDIAAVIAPADGDRLALAARLDGIPAHITARVEPHHVPAGLDLIVCAHAHAYIPASVRDAAKWGALGYHPSLLPRHRGRDAVRWAVHMRDTITGGTAYWLDDGADTGPIAAQDWCWVDPADTPQTLWRGKLAPMGLRLLANVLAQLDTGHKPATPQPQAHATWEPAFAKPSLAASGDAVRAKAK